MKAMDYLSEPKKPPKISVLMGEDDHLKVLVSQKLVAESEIGDAEKYEVTGIGDIVRTLGEGSLFGRRLAVFDLTTKKKWGRLDALAAVFRECALNDDQIIIRTTEAPSFKDLGLDRDLTVIECDIIKHKKTREKLIKLRADHYDVQLSEEAMTALLERTEATGEVENTLLSLKYAYGLHHKMKASDVERATRKPEERENLAKAILIGNSPRIAKQIKEGEPPLTLTIMHNTLLKLYTFLEMSSVKEAKEDDIVEYLQIHKRSLKDWRAAKTKYAPRAVRELMEAVTEAFQRVTRGDTESWRELLQFKFKNLGT